MLGGLVLPFLAGAPPARAEPSLRILVIGDSQAQGLAAGLQKVLRGMPAVRVLDRTRIGTGLIARGPSDWPNNARALAASEQPGVAVVMFGANDRPPVRTHGKVVPALCSAFEQRYGARVREVVTALHGAGAPVLWVGHPNVRDPEYTEDMLMLNDIYKRNVLADGGIWVPVWDAFVGPDGGFSAHGPGPGGETTRLRANDGIHMTNAGYEVIARRLLPYIEQQRGQAIG